MLDEETIGGDVVAVDDEAVVAEVAGPADAGAVIGAPDPGVVDDGVVGVDEQVDLGAAHAGSADAEEDIVQEDRILARALHGCLRGPISTRTGDCCGPASMRRPATIDAVDVGGGDGGGAVDGLERGEAKTEDDGVGSRDANRLREVVDSGSEEQILALAPVGR